MVVRQVLPGELELRRRLHRMCVVEAQDSVAVLIVQRQADDLARLSGALAIRAQERQEYLTGAHDAVDIDVELPFQIADRPIAQWPGGCDAGIVDEAIEVFARKRVVHVAGRRRDRGAVGDVENKRRERGTQGLPRRGGVLFIPGAAQDLPTVVEQARGDRPADTGGDARQDRRYCSIRHGF